MNETPVMAGQGRRPLSALLFLTLNLVLGLGHFLVLFNTGAYLPMIPYAAASLGHAPSFGDWTQSNFFVAMALAFPTAPWLMARFGEARTLTSAFLLFAAASLLCATTRHYDVFLFARGLQGYGGGLTIPLSLAAILRQYRPQKRNIGLILWGVASLTPFTLGPTVGGWITVTLGWRALFVMNVGVAVLVALASGAVLFTRDTPHRDLPFDWIGLLLLTATLLAFQFAFDVAETHGWWRSTRFAVLLTVGVVALVYLIIWESGEHQPLLDVRLFRRWNFAVGSMGLFLTSLVFQGLIALYIVQFELTLGYTAFLAGLLVLPMAVFSKLTSIITHHFMQRVDPRFLGFVALTGMSLGAAAVASYDRTASFDELLWPQALAGIFVGGLFPPFVAVGLSGLRGDAEVRAAGLLNLLRVSGQGLGIPLFAILWDRRQVVHRHFLAEASEGGREQIAQAVHTLHRHGLRVPVIHALIAKRLHHVAALLAFNEIFAVAAWVFLGLGILLLVARPTTFSEPDGRRRLAIQELAEP